jgi:multidrug efflux pump subunit AcrA (membrane-fusion protein)
MTETFKRHLPMALAALMLFAALIGWSAAVGAAKAGAPGPLHAAPWAAGQAAPADTNTFSSLSGSGTGVGPGTTNPAAQKLPPAKTTHRIVVLAGESALSSSSHDTVCPNNLPCDDTNK